VDGLEDISYSTYGTHVVKNNSSKEFNNISTPYSLPHTKFGSYKPMEWTIETILNLLHTTNDGRCILTDSKTNNGYLSDDAQNLMTQLLINHLLQDQSNYV
ncbi:Uncharacterized protein FWK35_00016184, partial [Aphis craccivora]